MLGGDPLADVLLRANAQAGPLCQAAALGLAACGDTILGLPTCSADPGCADPDACTGYTLAFDLTAVRVSRAVRDARLPALGCP